MCACVRVRVCACAGVWVRGYAGLCGVSVWHVISLRTKPSRVGSMDRMSSQFYNARRRPRPRRCIQGGVLALGAQQGGSCVHIRFSVRACAAQIPSIVFHVIHCRGEQHTLKDLQTQQQSNTPSAKPNACWRFSHDAVLCPGGERDVAQGERGGLPARPVIGRVFNAPARATPVVPRRWR